jgi:hypothetical protein
MQSVNTKNNFCLYLKFYETKISFIKIWEKIIDDIIDNNICPIYIWIESHKNIKDLQLYREDKINYITHYNKKDYNENILELEQQISIFIKNIGMVNQINHCQAHLKSFLLTKEETIIHLDGDDMFYKKLTVQDLINGVEYMDKNNLEIISRPYWITINRGWSFGFVIQKRSILDKLFIFNYNEIPNEYKIENLHYKNINPSLGINCGINLDIYFGLILACYHGKSFTELFFYYKSFPYWSDCENQDQQFIDYNVTREFCIKHNIEGI